MRCACIDIGSNTTRLLVADHDGRSLTACHEERAYTRIGAVVGPGGDIPADKLEEVAEVVTEQARRALELGASATRVVATAAVRRAANAEALISLIAERTDGLALELISGEQEARYAFIGALRTLPATVTLPSGRGALAVADVGGGSSELVTGTSRGDVGWWRSLPLGSGDLTELYFKSEMPEPSAIEEARNHVRLALEDAEPPVVKAALAVGGSGTSLRRLAGPVLDESAFRSALHLLVGTPPQEVASRSGLDVTRVRLLPAGLLILEGISRLLSVPLVVAAGGLREGVLLDGN